MFQKGAEERLIKGKTIKKLKRRVSCMAAFVLTCVTLCNTALAETFTVVGTGPEANYQSVTGEDGRDFVTNIFYVSDTGGHVYEALCANPLASNPSEGDTYETEVWYDDSDARARIYFYGLGSGSDMGPVAGLKYEQKLIVTHSALAFHIGDSDWNGGSRPLVGNPGDWGYDLVMGLCDYAYNNGLPEGWQAEALYLHTDGPNQDLVAYWEQYTEPKGNIGLYKSSSNTSITNGNSCYSLEGAKYGVYSDAGCTNLVTTMTTNSDGYAESEQIDRGTYWVKEISAPKGYLIDTRAYSVTVNSNQKSDLYVTDVPGNDPLYILLEKKNQATLGITQGDAKLGGAKYTVKYYDTQMTTDPAASGKTSKYTWVFKTDDNGRINLRDRSYYVGGDSLVYQDGQVVFPYGTVTIQETTAPAGYYVNPTVYVHDTQTRKTYVNGVLQSDLTSEQTPITYEKEFAGKIAITKNTHGTAENISYVSKLYNVPKEYKGEAGVQFQVYLKSAGSYAAAKDAEKQTITTNANGYAITKDLPYGVYTVHQVNTTPGYAMVADWDVAITQDGKTYSYTKVNEEQSTEIRLYKKGEVLTGYDSVNGFSYTEKYIAGAKYGIYSDSNCTQLIETITTTADTYTASSNTYKTGTYYLKEIEAVEPYTLDDTVYNVVITNSDPFKIIDVSEQYVNDTRQKVEIPVEKVSSADGSKLSDATFGLYAKEDIKDYQGNVIVTSGTKVSEIITGSEGTATFPIDLPVGYSFSVKEEESPIGYGNQYEEKPISTSYQGQTVDTQISNLKFIDRPTEILKTKAADYQSNDNQGALTENKEYTIIDHVDCVDLVPGKTYKISGTLMDKETGAEYFDINGNKVTAETTFTATSVNQTVDVTFNFSGELANKTVVVFEELYQQQKGLTTFTKIHEHKDINDVDQSVEYPEIHTTAVDGQTLNHTGTVAKITTIVDTVAYKNLTLGKEYTIKGVLYNKETGEKLLDKDNNEITGTTTFTCETVDGEVDVTFTLDSSLLGGKTAVVFEDLYYNDVKIATHSDITDDKQSVHYPEIKTTAKDESGVIVEKDYNDETSLKLVDTVSYTNLIIGGEYKVVGVLMDKLTGKELLDKNGKKITSEVTFTAEDTDGEVDVTFEFKRASLESLSTVVFEDLYSNNIKVATHSDIKDEGQTVTYESIIDITKLDSTGIIKVLDGAKLEILDKDGKVVYGPFVTTNKPTKIVGLLPGTYYIHEIEAPAGFKIAKDVEFTIKDTARIQHFSMTDEAIIGYVEFSYDDAPDWNKTGEVASDVDSIVKTGDTSNMMLYAIMMLSALLVMVLALSKKKRNIAKVMGIFVAVMMIGFTGSRIDASAAEDEYIEEVTFTSDNSKAEYDFPQTIQKDGTDYKLSKVDYKTSEKKVPGDVVKTITKKSLLTTYSTADFSDTIEEDGITYQLANVVKDTTGSNARTQYCEVTYDYSQVTSDKAIPETVVADYYDAVTNQNLPVTFEIVSKEVTSSEVLDEFGFTVTFYVTNGRYFAYKDHVITYNEKSPELMQFSDEILSDLNLDSDVYTITSIEWNGAAYTNEKGVLCRKADVKGQKAVKSYKVVYGGTANMAATSDAYQWVATYTATVNDPQGASVYDITGKATYVPAGEVGAEEGIFSKYKILTVFKNHPFVVSSCSILFVAACSIVLAFFLRTRKKNKYATE